MSNARVSMMPSTRCDVGRARAARLRSIAAAASAAVSLVAAVAHADPSKGDPAMAEALFKAARELVDAGDDAHGCPKFEASLAFNPSASTMLNIARCREREGKLAAAWEGYHRALVLNRETKGAERQRAMDALAKKGIAALEPRVPKLRIVIRDAPPGLVLLRDGREMPVATIGETLPADPGAHEISASAPGYRPAKRSAPLEEGKTTTIEMTLEKLAEPAVEPGPPAAPARDDGAARAARPSPHRIAAYATGGAGLAALAVGGILGGLTLAKSSVVHARCDASGACDHEGKLAADSAKTLALGSSIGVGAGLAAIGAATVLWLADPARRGARPPATSAAWVRPGVLSADANGAVLGLRGGF